MEKYKLGSSKTFHYLNQSKCHELAGVNDTQEYIATRRAMDIVGISETEQVKHLLLVFCCIIWLHILIHITSSQEAIFRVVASILHIGNISFAKGSEVDSSILKDDKSKFHFETAVELLKYGYGLLLLTTLFIYLFLCCIEGAQF